MHIEYSELSNIVSSFLSFVFLDIVGPGGECNIILLKSYSVYYYKVYKGYKLTVI